MVTSPEQIVMKLKNSLPVQEQYKDSEEISKSRLDLGKLTTALQTTLEIQPLLNILGQHLSNVVNQSGYTYENQNTSNLIKVGHRSHHSCSYKLSIESSSLGELTFTRRKRFTETDLVSIESALSKLLYPLKNALLYQSAIRSALTDSLTGVLNRSTLNTTFDQEIARVKRQKHNMSVLMLDIDFFKKVNDTFGHAAGDKALIAVTNCMKTTVREVDPIFRIGGEEFIIILGDTNQDGAELLAERIRCAVESLGIEHAIDAEPFNISVSIGLASYHHGDTAGDMMQRSDRALYTAKRQGRNRVISGD